MEIKRILKNLSKMLIVVVVVSIIITLFKNYILYANKIATVNTFYIEMVVEFILFTMIGILMGIETLLTERQKEGKWKVDLYKLIILGLPILLISFIDFIYYSNIEVGPLRFLVSNNFMYIFKIIFGYILVTSFIKKQNENITPEV